VLGFPDESVTPAVSRPTKTMEVFMRNVARALALLSAAVLIPSYAQAQVQNDRFQTHEMPWAATVHLPCALDGVGEDVTASGTILFQSHVVIDRSGKWHYSWMGTPQGLTGTGVTSGEVYHFTGVTRLNESGNGLPYTATYRNIFHIVGPHTGTNAVVHELWHITIRPDGTTAVVIDKATGQCQPD
jgi:hypothetical protein